MEPDIRHIGVRGGTFIIHNSHFYLARKRVSLNQNVHGSLQSWLSKPLLSSLAGDVMMSVWKTDDTITVFLAAVEMCKADRCLPWQWQFFPKLQPWQRCLMVAGTVTLHAELPPSLPTAQVRCCSGDSLAAPSCRRPLSRSLTSAETSHRSYTETRGLPTLMWLHIAHLGEKNTRVPSLLVTEFSAAVPAGCWGLAAPPRGEGGFSCPGVLGSLKWVLGVYRLSDWKHLLGLSCSFSSSTRENAGESLLEIREKLRAEERVNSLSSYTNIYDLYATIALSFYEMW